MGTRTRRAQDAKKDANLSADEALKVWNDLVEEEHDETFLRILNKNGFIHNTQIVDEEFFEDFDIGGAFEVREAAIWERVRHEQDMHSHVRNERDFLRKIVKRMAGGKHKEIDY